MTVKVAPEFWVAQGPATDVEALKLRSTAGAWRRVLDGLLMGRQGVIYSRGTCQDLKVNASAVPDVNITIKAGACYVRGTQATDQGMYHVFNDADLVIPLLTNNPANGANPRIDLVVARMQDQQYSGAVDVPTIEMVTGTPAGVPAVPAAPANSLILAQIAVGTAVATITQANITDRRVPAGNGAVVLDDIMVGVDSRYPAATAQIDFLNTTGLGTNLIPPGFDSLEIRYQARESGAASIDFLLMRLNGDAGNNYYDQTLAAAGAAVSAVERVAGVSSGKAGFIMGASVADAALAASGRIFIPNYAAQTFKKTWSMTGDYTSAKTTGTVGALQARGLWDNAAAVNRISILAGLGNIIVGSRLTLIGHVGLQP